MLFVNIILLFLFVAQNSNANQNQISQIQDDLGRLQTQLTDQNNTIADLTTKIDELNNKIDGQNSTIAEQNSKIEDQNNQIDELNNKIDGQNSTIAEQNSKIEDKNNQMDDLNNKIDGQNSTIAEQNSKIEEQNNQIEELNTKIDRQKSTIADQNSKIEEQNKQIEKLNQNLEEVNSKIIERNLTIAEQNSKSEQNSKIEDLNYKIAEQDKQIRKLDSSFERSLEYYIGTCSIKEKLEQEMTGTMFTRWGRSDCEGTVGNIVYSGKMGKTGDADYLCLSEDPIWDINKYNISVNSGSIEFTRYGNLPANELKDNIAPCAVCYAPRFSTMTMIPGRNKCYPGWQMAFSGELMGVNNPICLDGDSKTNGNYTSGTGAVLQPLKVQCGTGLSCQPYEKNALVTCAVCLKSMDQSRSINYQNPLEGESSLKSNPNLPKGINGCSRMDILKSRLITVLFIFSLVFTH